ncbi:ribosomal RNA small subunit methyltransferase A [Candidatus Saganbacteria bacterium]|uniref:Ribosomal RNA small subunit methyltransferase A n=1 Tax=Candidatus Saganbacteria bacterium TaxID=2575572 RepID=A0A9D6UPQ0_UNCSA|nr:ribosomal RNA small subunit methyltransferase A [Candidatus Saganbacteria bacterium]
MPAQPPTLAEITRELLLIYNRRPVKRWGQHFLVDPNVLQRIVAAAELKNDDLVIEIGSGLGVLTSELAKCANWVFAVEIDKELAKISKEVLKPRQNISFIERDILRVNLSALTGEKKYKVVGNLPYYITAPIVEKITKAENKPELAVIMAQREVAERMSAVPGSKKYGSFSIFAQYHAEVKIDSFVSKSSFLPWPEVGSAIVVLRPYPAPKYPVKNEKLFFDLVHAAFQQRRKKLRNSLSEYDLEGSGIDLNRRPEELSIEEFGALSAQILSSLEAF